MVGNKRHRFSFGEVREFWSRWRRGETLTQIAVALGVRPCRIFSVVQARGGSDGGEARVQMKTI